MCLTKVTRTFDEPDERDLFDVGRYGYKVVYLKDGYMPPWWKFWQSPVFKPYYYERDSEYKIGKEYIAKQPKYKEGFEPPYRIGFHAHWQDKELHEFMDHLDADKKHVFEHTAMVRVKIMDISAFGHDRSACMKDYAAAFVGMRQTITEVIRIGK